MFGAFNKPQDKGDYKGKGKELYDTSWSYGKPEAHWGKDPYEQERQRQKGKKGKKGYGKKGKKFDSDASEFANALAKPSGDCPFYSKIGACRHGTACSRQHNKVETSRTLLFAHIFAETEETFRVSSDPIDPNGALSTFDDEMYCIAVGRIEEFYEEFFYQMAKFGEIEDVVLVDNISDHMAGNAYVKYFEEDAAIKAFNSTEDMWYNGRKLKVEYSPVNEFRDARCRAFNESTCPRGQACNFIHVRHVPKAIKRGCALQMYDDYQHYSKKREETGRPLVYKSMAKIDWNNDAESREEFKKKWWTAYNQRRKQEKEAEAMREKEQAEAVTAAIMAQAAGETELLGGNNADPQLQRVLETMEASGQLEQLQALAANAVNAPSTPGIGSPGKKRRKKEGGSEEPVTRKVGPGSEVNAGGTPFGSEEPSTPQGLKGTNDGTPKTPGAGFGPTVFWGKGPPKGSFLGLPPGMGMMGGKIGPLQMLPGKGMPGKGMPFMMGKPQAMPGPHNNFLHLGKPS